MKSVNLRHIGQKFERRALPILEKEGYFIVQHTSSIDAGSPYDFIVEKNNIRYYLEVRGRDNQDPYTDFYFSKKKLRRLRNLGNVKILILNNKSYKFVNISEINKDCIILRIKHLEKKQKRLEKGIKKVSKLLRKRKESNHDKRPITKRKKTFAIDIEIDDKLNKMAKKQKTKKSRIVNEILRSVLLDKHFITASKLYEEVKRK